MPVATSKPSPQEPSPTPFLYPRERSARPTPIRPREDVRLPPGEATWCGLCYHINPNADGAIRAGSPALEEGLLQRSSRPASGGEGSSRIATVAGQKQRRRPTLEGQAEAATGRDNPDNQMDSWGSFRGRYRHNHNRLIWSRIVKSTPTRVGAVALALLFASAYTASQGHYAGGGLLALAGSVTALTLIFRGRA